MVLVPGQDSAVIPAGVRACGVRNDEVSLVLRGSKRGAALKPDVAERRRPGRLADQLDRLADLAPLVARLGGDFERHVEEWF